MKSHDKKVSGRAKELVPLGKLASVLEEGKPARSLELLEDDLLVIKDLNLITPRRHISM